MEAADDESVAVSVGQGKGETLVAAGLLERIESNEADPLDRPSRLRFEDRRAGGQLVELAGNRQDLVEVGVENRFEAAAFCATGDSIETATEERLAPRLHGHDREEEKNEDEEADDDRAQIRGDESVQIDRTVLRQASEAAIGGQPSLAGAMFHEPRGRPMLSSAGSTAHPSEASRTTWRSAPASAVDPANVGPCSEPPAVQQAPDPRARRDP
jgi:hypothetical protein